MAFTKLCLHTCPSIKIWNPCFIYKGDKKQRLGMAFAKLCLHACPSIKIWNPCFIYLKLLEGRQKAKVSNCITYITTSICHLSKRRPHSSATSQRQLQYSRKSSPNMGYQKLSGWTEALNVSRSVKVINISRAQLKGPFMFAKPVQFFFAKIAIQGGTIHRILL